MEPSNKR